MTLQDKFWPKKFLMTVLVSGILMILFSLASGQDLTVDVKE